VIGDCPHRNNSSSNASDSAVQHQHTPTTVTTTVSFSQQPGQENKIVGATETTSSITSKSGDVIASMNPTTKNIDVQQAIKTVGVPTIREAQNLVASNILGKTFDRNLKKDIKDHPFRYGGRALVIGTAIFATPVTLGGSLALLAGAGLAEGSVIWDKP
jgi:hypothetical protein